LFPLFNKDTNPACGGTTKVEYCGKVGPRKSYKPQAISCKLRAASRERLAKRYAEKKKQASM